MTFIYTLTNSAVTGTDPAGTDLVSLGDDNIRNFKSAVLERINSRFVDANTDPWIIKSPVSGGNTQSLVPTADNLYTLGTAALRFSDIRTMTLTASSGVVVSAGGISVTGGLTVSAGTTAVQAVTATTYTGTGAVTINSASHAQFVANRAGTAVHAGSVYQTAGVTNWLAGPGAGTTGTNFEWYNASTAGIGMSLSYAANVLTVGGGLTVSAGGIAVTGNSSIIGTLTGLTGVTSSSYTVSGATASSTTGDIRTPKDFALKGRDFGNTSDLNLLSYSGGNQIAIGDNGVGVAVGGASSSTLGFFRTSGGSTKNTVAGSRSANAALASLLTALSNYGLVTDSSTA